MRTRRLATIKARTLIVSSGSRPGMKPVRDLGCQQFRRETAVLSRLVEPEYGAAVSFDRLDRTSDDLCDAAGHVDGGGAQRGDVVWLR